MRRDEYTPDGRFQHDGAVAWRAVTKLQRSVQLLREYEQAGVGSFSIVLPQLERLIKHLKEVNRDYELAVQNVIHDRDAINTNKPEQGAVLGQLSLQSRRSKRTAHEALTNRERAFGTEFMNNSLMFAAGITSNTGIDDARGPERAFLQKFAATLANLAEANFMDYPRDIGDTTEEPTTVEVAREYFGKFVVAMEAIADSVAVDLVKASLATVDDSNVIQFRPRNARATERDLADGPGDGPGTDPGSGPGGGLAG